MHYIHMPLHGRVFFCEEDIFVWQHSLSASLGSTTIKHGVSKGQLRVETSMDQMCLLVF